MHNNLPFKPLLITVALASLFPMGIASASTYGIHANSQDLIIEDQNTFENVDYGVAAENGHTATINSAGDLTFTVKKAGAYIKENTTGSVIINAGNTLTINGSDNQSVAGMSVESKTGSDYNNLLRVAGKNIILDTKSNGTARGIYAESRSNSSVKLQTDVNVELAAAETLQISSDGSNFSFGIAAEGAKTAVDVQAKDLSISSIGSKAYGVKTKRNAEVNIAADDVVIDVKNQADKATAETYGLLVEAGSSGYERDSSISISNANTVKISAVSSGASAIKTAAIRGKIGSESGTAIINLAAKDIQLTAAGSEATGVEVVYGGKVNIGNEFTNSITIASLDASAKANVPVTNVFKGLQAYGKDENDISEINLTAASINIDAQAKSDAVGIHAASNSLINVGDGRSNVSIRAVSTDAQKAIGVWVFSNEFKGGNSTIVPKKAGEVNLNGETISIYAEGGSDVRAVQVASNQMDPEKKATLNIKGRAVNIEARSTIEGVKSMGLSVMSTGMVNIEGNTVITADHALLARGDASIEINKDGKYSTQINGDVVFDYDAETSGTGVNANVDVTLAGANSYWIGNTVVAWAGLPDNVESDKLTVTDMKLTVKNGAQWTPTAIVSTDPTAQNGQRAVALNSLVLDNGVVNITDKSVNATVEKLSGSGTVRLATDLTADEDQQAGTFTVDSADADSSLTVKLANEDLTKDLTSDDVTSDQAKQLLGNVAAEGVETTMKVDEGMYNEGFIIDSEAKVHSTGPNSVMQSTLELATIAPLALNRILTNDVHKRMGNIRSMKQTSGAWARYDGGRLSAESGLENDFHTIQVGVDTVPTAGAPRFGVAFSYTMSDADYRRGKADMDVYSLAAYGLWMGENGQFADVVARLGTAKTDMTVDGNKKGSMDNIVTALSGEFGWRFDLSKSFYLEPQVELAYTHVDADVLSLSDSSTYRFDDADSLMGRAGFAFGMRCPENGSTAYLRVSAVHEFLGDNAVIGGNGKVYDIDGKDTWVEYGLGANFNLTDSTYVWADVERTSGGYLDEDWRATVGVRHAF